MSVKWLNSNGALPHTAQGLWEYSAGGSDSFLGITLSEAREHLKKSSFDTNDDTLITEYIKAATRQAGEYMNRAVKVEQWILRLTEWPTSGVIAASKGDYISGLSIQYYDANNASQTLTVTTDYLFQDAAGVVYIKLKNTPSFSDDYPFPVNVTAVYGWNTVVPESVKSAIRLIVGDLYEQRQSKFTANSTSEFATYIKDLLNPYRLINI